MAFVELNSEGPITRTRLNLAGRDLIVVRPEDPDRLLDAAEVRERNLRDDYMPYWAYLWPAARLLAEAVAREPWTPGTEALEIGCGLGLVGLAGLAAGLRVRFTDYDAGALRFVERSAAENGFPVGSYSTGLLDWHDLPEGRWPVILGSDVLYERRLVPLVVNLIDCLLAPGGLALIAGPYRVATEDLPAAIDRRGLRTEPVPMEALDQQGAVVRGLLHRIRRKVEA